MIAVYHDALDSWAAQKYCLGKLLKLQNQDFRSKSSFGLGHLQTLALAVGWQPEEPGLYCLGYLCGLPLLVVQPEGSRGRGPLARASGRD